MEGLKKRIYFVALALILVGAFNTYAGISSAGEPKTEAWMEERAPDVVMNMGYAPSAENPEQSYRMDESTYKTLTPFGIVARSYSGKAGEYDAVLIASRSRSSFHDPRVCFTAQRWKILEEKPITIETKTRGIVPATLVIMEGPRTRQIAAYFYRGPTGFKGSTVQLKFDMFWQRLLGRSDVDGVFYRFIPGNTDCTEEELKQFIAEYLEEAKKSSGGYF